MITPPKTQESGERDLMMAIAQTTRCVGYFLRSRPVQTNGANLGAHHHRVARGILTPKPFSNKTQRKEEGTEYSRKSTVGIDDIVIK